MSLDDPCHDDPVANYGHLLYTLSFHAAVKIIKGQLAARGEQVRKYSAKQIRNLADAYFEDNRSLLMCETLLKVRSEPSLLRLAEAEAKRRARERQPKPMNPRRAQEMLDKILKR